MEENITTASDGEKTTSEDQKVDYKTLAMSAMPEEVRNRRPIVTLGLIGVSVLASLLMLYRFDTLEPDPQKYISMGADVDFLIYRGQIWRLFTSSFLHFGIAHLICNMLCLYSIGVFLEKLVGHGKLFSIYLLTACTGGLLSCAVHSNVVSAGASGAVFGLFGATVTYIAVAYKNIGIEVSYVAGYMKNGLAFLGVNLVYSLMPGVDMAGHIGGLLGGLVIGGILGAPERQKGLGHKNWCDYAVAALTRALMGVMLLSVFTARDAGRLDTNELAAQVGDLLKEKMTEGIKEKGFKVVNVEITNLTLVHDGGDDYHGDVDMKCAYDGNEESLSRTINVTYDGEQFAYQLGEVRDTGRLDVNELSVEVGNLLKEKMTEGLKEQGFKAVNVEIINLALAYNGGDDYHGDVVMKCAYDGNEDSFSSAIKVTYDGERLECQLSD